MIEKGIRITQKQKEFCHNLLKSKNATEAALQAYNISDPTTSTARAIACTNLAKTNVRKYLEAISSSAAERIEVLSVTARNESVRLKANQDILDRAGYKPVDNIDLTSKGEKIDKIENQVALILNGKLDVQKREDS